MSHYDVLGVGRSADPDALHRAYVALARRHHPDLEGGDATRMRAINEAWAILGDPVRRARYDRSLSGAVAAERSPQSDPTGQDDDLARDLIDDRPLRAVVVPRWLSLVPVATFALSVLAFCVGLVVSSEPLLGLALMAFALSCVFFLAAPFVALFSSRRSTG